MVFFSLLSITISLITASEAVLLHLTLVRPENLRNSSKTTHALSVHNSSKELISHGKIQVAGKPTKSSKSNHSHQDEQEVTEIVVTKAQQHSGTFSLMHGEQPLALLRFYMRIRTAEILVLLLLAALFLLGAFVIRKQLRSQHDDAQMKYQRKGSDPLNYVFKARQLEAQRSISVSVFPLPLSRVIIR